MQSFINEFKFLLEQNGKGKEWFFTVSSIAGFAFSLASIAASHLMNLSFYYSAAIAAGFFASPFLLHYLLQKYLFELRKRKKEELVADMLLQASAFPRGTAFEKIIQYFSEERFGLLGKEFEKALEEMEKGATIQQALGNIAKRCRSSVISRATELLKQLYESGADMAATLREAAENILETNAILRERNSTLIIDKYTLLLAGGIVVPAVLGLLVNMVYSMDFSALEMLEFGRSVAEKRALLQATITANQIYIVEYALLASFFVANIEGNSKKALLYAMFLLPLSLLSFNAAKFLL